MIQKICYVCGERQPIYLGCKPILAIVKYPSKSQVVKEVPVCVMCKRNPIGRELTTGRGGARGGRIVGIKKYRSIDE